MPLMPFSILGIWLRGLLALAILGGAVALLTLGYREANRVVPQPVAVETNRPTDAPRADQDREVPGQPAGVVERHVVGFRPAWDRRTAYLVGGLALLTWGLLGGLIARGVGSLTSAGSSASRSGGNSAGGRTTTPGRPARGLRSAA